MNGVKAKHVSRIGLLLCAIGIHDWHHVTAWGADENGDPVLSDRRDYATCNRCRERTT